MTDVSTLPPDFYKDFGIEQDLFQSAFQDSGNAMFSLRPGWSLGFTHAVLTTGDKPKTVASVGGEPLEASAAKSCGKSAPKGHLSLKSIAVYITAPTPIVNQRVLKRQEPLHMSTLHFKRHNMTSAS